MVLSILLILIFSVLAGIFGFVLGCKMTLTHLTKDGYIPVDQQSRLVKEFNFKMKG